MIDDFGTPDPTSSETQSEAIPGAFAVSADPLGGPPLAVAQADQGDPGGSAAPDGAPKRQIGVVCRSCGCESVRDRPAPGASAPREPLICPSCRSSNVSVLAIPAPAPAAPMTGMGEIDPPDAPAPPAAPAPAAAPPLGFGGADKDLIYFANTCAPAERAGVIAILNRVRIEADPDLAATQIKIASQLIEALKNEPDDLSDATRLGLRQLAKALATTPRREVRALKNGNVVVVALDPETVAANVARHEQGLKKRRAAAAAATAAATTDEAAAPEPDAIEMAKARQRERERRAAEERARIDAELEAASEDVEADQMPPREFLQALAAALDDMAPALRVKLDPILRTATGRLYEIAEQLDDDSSSPRFDNDLEARVRVLEKLVDQINRSIPVSQWRA